MAQFGDVNVIPSSLPFEKATEFENEYLQRIYDGLTGYRLVFEDVVTQSHTEKMLGEDGVERYVVVPDKMEKQLVRKRDKDAPRPCNDAGAEYVCRELRYLFNRPAAMGELENDELVRINASVTERIFNHMIANDVEFEVGDADALLTERVSIMNGIHMYLTSLKNGGLKQWSKETLTQTASNDQPQQNGGNPLDALNKK